MKKEVKEIRTQVFAYKGIVGIKSDVNAVGVLNKPAEVGQLGFVCDAAFVDISPEAIEILKKIPKSGDCIGDVDVWKTNDGKVIFGWLGGPLKMVDPKDDISGSRSYDPSLLSPSKGVEIDKDFIMVVDMRNQKRKI